ncbi:MAG: hypothetical protein GY739_09115 [Mesoflavibacter sp.]|nr:hypothetical protein [Mesoflavibacter sp.]
MIKQIQISHLYRTLILLFETSDLTCIITLRLKHLWQLLHLNRPSYFNKQIIVFLNVMFAKNVFNIEKIA